MYQGREDYEALISANDPNFLAVHNFKQRTPQMDHTNTFQTKQSSQQFSGAKNRARGTNSPNEARSHLK